MAHAIGTRIGALLGADQGTKEIHFIGWGSYTGEEVPDEQAGGLAAVCREAGRTNPRLVMDDGAVVWGAECWWGEPWEINAAIAELQGRGFRLVQKPMAEWRRRTKAAEVQA